MADDGDDADEFSQLLEPSQLASGVLEMDELIPVLRR